MRYTAYIGLGSNLASSVGDSAETVRAAIQALGELGGVVAQSSLYQTAPVGYREQPDFINAVAVLETRLEPESLLRKMLAIERSFGRDRRVSVPKGSRTLDLDLLLAHDVRSDAVVCESDALTLPHPEMEKRRFVLQPLAEIAAELRHPVLGKTMQELLDELPDRGDDVTRIE